MIRSFLIIVQICVYTICTHAQSTAWEMASKQEIVAAYHAACNWFINTPSYYFKLRYASYKDHVSKDKLESSEGYYKRVGKNYVTEAVGIKTTQNNNLKIVVDTSDKIITVMNPGNLSPTIASSEELDNLLNSVKALKKARIGKSIRYRIEFNKNELYEAYEFVINTSGLMEGLTYYYCERVEKEDVENGNEKAAITAMKPRLEITFFGFQIPAKHVESEFIERAIYFKEKGRIELTGIYKDYRLMDYRVQTKK